MTSHTLFNQIHTSIRTYLTRILQPTVSPVALLVDGDNHADMTADLLASILIEAGKFGGVTVRRVYGNWKTAYMAKWKDFCQHYAFEAIHLSSIQTTGKNAADIALTVDALDLLRLHGITYFFLVASDSDYVPLVRRLRASGCIVIIVGRSTTPQNLKQESTVFIPIENLLVTPTKVDATNPTLPITATPEAITTTVKTKKATSQNGTSILLPLLLETYEKAAQDSTDGWVAFQIFNTTIHKLDPSFTLKSYKYKGFEALFKAHAKDFEVKKETEKDKTIHYVRKKR